MEAGSYAGALARWRALAGAAAEALDRGELGLARALLTEGPLAGGPWASPGVEILLRRLREAPPRADGRAWALLAPGRPEDGEAEPLAELRQRSWQQARSGDPPPDPLPLGLVELATQGWLLRELELRPWREAGYPPEPRDRRVAELWRGWTSGQPWPLRDEWERLFLKPAMAAFAAVLRGRNLPEDLRRRALADVREGFFYALVGRGAEAGWREIAVRLLETTGEEPLVGLCRALPEAAWERVARCAVTRGHGRQTAGLVWGEVGGWQVQARSLRSSASGRPEVLSELLHLHLALRLIEHWQDPDRLDPARGAAVVAHNRGRARSRLRAILRESPAEHFDAQLRRTPALYARTRFAVARFARDWAWQQVQHGFAFYDGRTLDPACVLPEGAPPPLPDGDRPALRAWVLRVVLKGRLPWLRQWVQGGAEVDPHDATWGRLLKDDCPECLRGWPGARRNEGLDRLRAELSEQLTALLVELAPVVSEVARLSPAPGAEPAFHALLAPAWDPRVALPRVRVRDYVEAARRALPGMGGEVLGLENIGAIAPGLANLPLTEVPHGSPGR